MDPASFERSGSWLTFLRNHLEAIGAMNFFIVPTLTFGVLYFFFVISHDRDLSTTAGTRNWRQVSRNAAASASHDGLSKATPRNQHISSGRSGSIPIVCFPV